MPMPKKRTQIESGLSIALRGATQHNLKSLDIDFPIHQLTVLCGVSGSGKSSLAFDTLYAEGQRRYIESFSAYTRQFLQRLEKPKFESLEPLPPSIAVTRDVRSRNNRSTVGTASEILEYLRTMFATYATLTCIECGTGVIAHTPHSVLESLQSTFGTTHPRRAMVGFLVRWNGSEELALLLTDLQASGYVRIVVDGKTFNLGSSLREEMATHFAGGSSGVVIVERLQWTGTPDERWEEAIGTSLEQAILFDDSKCVLFMEPVDGVDEGNDEIELIDGKPFLRLRFSPYLRCEHCDREYTEPSSSLFNFNHPLGACPECEGFGEVITLDMDKVVPDKSLSLRNGAIAPWRTPSYAHELEELLALATEYDLPVDLPVQDLTPSQWKIVEKGIKAKKFGGLDGFFAWLERKKYKMHVRIFLSRWRSYSLCPACQGKRLNPQALAYRLANKSFAELCDESIDRLIEIVQRVVTGKLPEPELLSSAAEREEDGSHFWKAAEKHAMYNAGEPVRQVLSRLEYLADVGLGYLSLSRSMHTLSSGEAQRVGLTTLLGSTLVDMLYVFDEPTVGLHPTDVKRISDSILKIRDRGNTVLLVEHEPAMIQLADRVLEIGPAAGERGGEVCFDGSPKELIRSSSVTGKYLRGEKERLITRRHSDRFLELIGASGRNLKEASIAIPVGCLTVVEGPSGSGKSSLLLDTLVPALGWDGEDESKRPLPYQKVAGFQRFDKVRSIDQSPIPRSGRSTPATYCKAMDPIREAFASTPDAKGRRFTSSHFSFNSDKGRCAACEGLGTVTVEMQFMADVALPCGDCNGKRYRPEVLDVTYRDRNIDDVLQMSVAAASDFFRGERDIQDRLKLLLDIGLGYLPLGQKLSTLSAGESMRLKLASVLGEASRKGSGELIVMDEPTTGLHFVDIDRLLDCMDVLRDRGHTIIVIEHNQQFIDAADYRIQLGPGAGPFGGQIISQGFS